MSRKDDDSGSSGTPGKGKALLACHKLLHKLLGGKSLRYKRNGLDMFVPILLMTEKL